MTAASTATDQRFQQGKITPSQANDQSQILSAAKRQMGAAGWGSADPWHSIKAGPVRVKPHKTQVRHSSSGHLGLYQKTGIRKGRGTNLDAAQGGVASLPA